MFFKKAVGNFDLLENSHREVVELLLVDMVAGIFQAEVLEKLFGLFAKFFVCSAGLKYIEVS